MIFHAFLIKYAEIAIKGKNRYIFEDALVTCIRYCWNLPCSDLRRSGIRADGKGRSFLHEELPSELRRKFQSIYKKSKEILSDHIHGS